MENANESIKPITSAVDIQIPAQSIIDTLECGLDSGYIGYWMHETESGGDPERVMQDPDFTAKVWVNEDEGPAVEYTYNRAKIQKALQLVIEGKECGASRLSEIVHPGDKGDAETSDVFWQLVLFGKMIYG